MKQNQISHYTSMNRYPDIFTEVKSKYPTPQRILSFGCSTGEECVTLHKYFPCANVIGLDINEEIIEQNKIQNKYEKIEYHSKVDSLKNKYDLIFANSVLCVWPENTGEYTFETFEETLKVIDDLLNVEGILCIYNSKYLFTETIIFHQNYKIINTQHNETGFVTKYHKNNEKISNTFKYYLFKKIK